MSDDKKPVKIKQLFKKTLSGNSPDTRYFAVKYHAASWAMVVDEIHSNNTRQVSILCGTAGEGEWKLIYTDSSAAPDSKLIARTVRILTATQCTKWKPGNYKEPNTLFAD